MRRAEQSRLEQGSLWHESVGVLNDTLFKLVGGIVSVVAIAFRMY